MKFLVDENLSPRLADELGRAGHQAEHVRDLGLKSASDEAVLRRALLDERTVVSADTDFGFLLAVRGANRPSVILVRLRTPRSVGELAAVLLANLDALSADLEAGATVVLEDDRIRIRSLPLRSG